VGATSVGAIVGASAGGAEVGVAAGAHAASTRLNKIIRLNRVLFIVSHSCLNRGSANINYQPESRAVLANPGQYSIDTDAGQEVFQGMLFHHFQQ
jgi:hypothetical protein